GDLLILPECGLAAFHVADSADAIDEGHVVAVTPVNAKGFAIDLGGWLAGEGVLVVHLDRVGGIEAEHAVVLDIDAGDAIARGRHDEGIVKAHLARAGSDLAVPVERVAVIAE